MKPCADYARLLKTLCIDTESSEYLVLSQSNDGKLILDFDAGTPNHRRMELEAPNAQHPQYIGNYLKVEDSNLVNSGTITIEPQFDSMSLKYNVEIKDQNLGSTSYKFDMEAKEQK